MKRLLFAVGVFMIGIFWFNFLNFDIFLPAIAFAIYLKKDDLKNLALLGAIIYSVAGTYLWYGQLSSTVLTVLFIGSAFVLASYLFSRSETMNSPITKNATRILAVILYDNFASIPIFASALMSGGLSALIRQISLGIPFTAVHIISFITVYYSWVFLYQLSGVSQEYQQQIN